MLTLLCFILTVSTYWGAKWCYQKTKKVYLSPLLIAPLVIILILILFNINYETYNQGAKWLTIILQPATVALAIPLYRYYPVLKKYFREIFASVLLGSIIAIFVSFFLAKLVHLNQDLLASIIPFSITTPIAMEVSDKIGGIRTITAVFVIMTGIIGMVLGPWIIRLFQFKNDITKGVLLGTSSHGAGTSKALELGSMAGAVSSICMVLAGILTFWLLPWIYLHVLS
ncbi:CidB/LrgB family autolysis modulator [Bacillus sp. Bva_UNVM-123]|uniref:CidB/LrgB family autolysis modulator n=1 Tax=Bacillus sp. Bva_UNVM-123 TaxID=2829798 RepID=UPI00391F24BD